MATPTTYTQQQKDAVVRQLRQEGVGLADVHKATGIPKPTITRWAKKAGLSTTAKTKELAAQTATATLARQAQTAAEAQELREGMIKKLQVIAHTAMDVQLQILAAIRRREKMSLPEGVSLHHIVGAGTRAVHDLELLLGGATERVDGEQHVFFTAPRPDRNRPPEIVDLGRVPDMPATYADGASSPPTLDP